MDQGSDSRSRASREPLYWSWWGWEPLDHYRRVGGVAGAVDGSAAWLTHWYTRLHTEELVQTMADLGVNLAVTHFFKGFGLMHERDEHARLQQLVHRANRHGIRVLGYCQSRSLYYETILAEVSTASEWIQKEVDGRNKTWGGSYYRWAPCVMSRGFRDYIKEVIRFGLEEIGLDGFHFDNDYAQPCYCDTCEQAFRAWLTERFPNPREHFGLASFDHVRQPPPRQRPGAIRDPLERAWVRFRCEGLAEFHEEITTHARAIRPGVLLCGNPAYPRRPHAAYENSVWAPLLGRHLDLMFAENGNFPGINGGALVSQIRGYKQGGAVGYRVISTTWRRGDASTPSGLPETAAEVELQVAEAAANGGIPGSNWALRPLNDGSLIRIDRAELRDALRRSLDFVRRNEERFAGASPVRDVAVLRTFASLTYDTRLANDTILAVEEALIQTGFSWEALFADDLAPLDEFGVLVVAGQSHLSDSECDAIRRFAANGGGVVLIGQNGIRDEWGRTRGQDGLNNLGGERVVQLDEDVPEPVHAPDHSLRIPLSSAWKEGVATAVQRAAGGQTRLRLMGEGSVSVSAYTTASGELAVHLVNYAPGEPASRLRLDLRLLGRSAIQAQLLTPERPALAVEIRQSGRHASIPLPEFSTYAVLCVNGSD